MPVYRRLALFTLIVIAIVVARPSLESAAPRHVVMISIDGLKPSTYTTDGPSKVPTLRRLAREGAFADGVTGVTPTVTYPSHTTLITGVLPAVHGIYNNRILDPEETSNASWYWYAREIQAPTLPGVVKARGLTTAAINWPVTVGADIDYLMPEFAGVTRHPEWLELLRALSKPQRLLDTYEGQGHTLSWPQTDMDRASIAAWTIRTYKPALTLLHIFETDEAQHTYGPGSPQALEAIEEADRHVEIVARAVADAGIQDSTDIVVVSDHGFLPLQKQLQPNAAFKRDGLLNVDARGKITRWDAYFYGAGGSGFVILSRPDDAALRDRVGALLQRLAADPANGILTVWTRDDLRKMGAEPRASFGIDMRDGFYSSAGHDALVVNAANKGGHGFAPTRPDLRASLVMRGPDVPKVGSLGVVRMTQIGPTIASWFDVALSPHADSPIVLKPKTSATP